MRWVVRRRNPKNMRLLNIREDLARYLDNWSNSGYHKIITPLNNTEL